MNRALRIAGAILTLALLARPTLAQQPAAPDPLRPLRIAKWSALAAAATTAAFGFLKNAQADDRFSRLEQLCEAEPARCIRRTPGGAYQDPEFEARFQEVRSLDRTAQRALLASQIAVGTSVVLFLLDLGNVRRPPDIPYVPTAVDLDARTDGAIGLRFSIALPRSHATS
jgi:hypothetical protein